MDGYTRAVSGQRLGKQVPAATDTKGTIAQVQKSCVFNVVPAGMLLREKVKGYSVDNQFLRESVKTGLERMKLKNFQC
jgi:hypothetical protein